MLDLLLIAQNVLPSCSQPKPVHALPHTTKQPLMFTKHTVYTKQL